MVLMSTITSFTVVCKYVHQCSVKIRQLTSTGLDLVILV